MGLHFFTSIVANYLPKARVLCESIRRFHPSATIHVVLSDRVPSWLTPETEPFDHLLTLEDLPLPNLTSWLFSHDLVELSTAVKGFALQQILSRDDCDQVVYLDPDILVLSSLDGLLANFAEASILLTPHQTRPETTYENVRDNELLTIQHGAFNLGFLAVKKSETGRLFAQWWADRLRDFCFDDIPIGLFVDQRWPDLIPSFFPDHKVLRDPAFNVAYWNLTQRTLAGNLQDGITVDGQPLVFFHFSGIDSGREWAMLQRWAARMPALFELRDWYLAECNRHGDAVISSTPWAYGSFSSGDPILKKQRLLYRNDPDLQARFPDPYARFPAQLLPLAEAQDEEVPVRPYRIFLIAAPADEQYIDATLAALKSTTVESEQLWLVTRSLARDVQSVAVDATRYEDFAAHILNNFADKDIILIRAGAITPPQWDLRLAWTAARHPSGLTISPLDRRTLDEPGLFALADPDHLDRLCYFYRQSDELEVGYFSHDCVFINSTGLRDVAAGRSSLRLNNLLDDAARKRWQHLQATHLCLSFRCPLSTTALWMTTFSEQAFLRPLQNSLRNHDRVQGLYVPRRITSALTSATLHICHNWGGGVEQWVRSFSETDSDHDQLVLRSVGPNAMFGRELALYRYDHGDLECLRTWELSPAIRATAIAHQDYRKLLEELAGDFAVGRVIVSSLIGHSLDCLRTRISTLFVCHDYYPFCSAINLTFGEVCRSCEEPRLAACLEENPLNHNFPNVVRSEWLALRAEFLQALSRNDVKLIAPSPSVKANYLHLVPELASSFQVIRHGLREFQNDDVSITPPTGQRFRVLLLGSLIPHKGVFLLDAMLEELLSFADLTLAGCLDTPGRFSENPKITLIPEYKQADLARLIAEVQPSVGLFLSVWPETFSYTLHELQSLGIPPVATNIGGFTDFIEEGVTGFLCEPEPLSLLHRLRHLAANPSALAKVRCNLSRLPRRSVSAMVEDYAALTPDDYSVQRYFSGPRAPKMLSQQDLQLYWRGSQGGFSEADSFRFAPFHLNSQTARLYIPAVRSPIAHLRFDPGSAPGLIQIARMTLCQKTGEVLWSSPDCVALLSSAPHERLYPLSENVLGVTGEDPQIQLPVPQEALAALSQSGGYLEVEFSWSALESNLHALVSAPEMLSHELTRTRNELENLQAVLATKEEQFSSRSHQLNLVREQAQALADVQQSLVNSLSWRLTKPLRKAGELGRKLTGRG